MADLQTQLIHLFAKEINSFLTTDDVDTPPVPKKQVEKFMKDNLGLILAAVQRMMNDYEADGELDDLRDPMPDWIREYVYDGELDEKLNARRPS